MGFAAIPRSWRKPAIAGLASVGVLGVGAGVALGPAAAWLVDEIADGQKIWRIGNLQIDGVEGPHIGALRAQRLSLRDARGIWAEARDVDLHWRPLALLTGEVRLDAARIGDLHVLRQPEMTPKGDGGGGSIDVRIENLALESVRLDEPVYGVEAALRAELGLNLQDKSLERLTLRLERTDSDADRAIVTIQRGEHFVLNADVESAPGGVIARALGIGEQGLSIDAQGEGDESGGEARWSGAVGEAPLSRGSLSWDATRWRLDAQAYLDALPMLRAAQKRLGDEVTIGGGGERGGHFTALARSPLLSLDIEGEADEGLNLNGPARVDAETADLSAVVPEAPVALGPAHFSGTFTRQDGRMALSGALTARRVEALGQTTSLSGDVRFRMSDERIDATADLRAPEAQQGLFQNARVDAALQIDRKQGRFRLRRARIESEGLALNAQGWTRRGDGEFSGEWRARRLGDFASGLEGAIGGRWRFQAEPETGQWAGTLNGEGDGVGGTPDFVPQGLGADPRLDASFRYENRGVTLSHARIDGERLRAGAMGRIVGGQADLRVELSARGPLTVGAAQFDGAMDAVGHVTGRIAKPRLELNARLASFSVGGASFVNPDVDLTLAPDAGGQYRGHAEARATYSEQPASVSTDIALIEGGVDLTQLDAHLGALDASGRVRASEAGLNADLALTGSIDNLAPGVSGRIDGALTIAEEALSLNADLAMARFGELRVREAHVDAHGPFRSIAAQFTFDGALRRAPLNFAGDAAIQIQDGVEARITGQGALAGERLATREPIFARWGERDLQANLNIILGEGGLIASWRERGASLSADADLQNAPLAPIAAIWGEAASGTGTGSARIASSGGGLSGEVDLNVNDARVAGRQRGTLDAHLVASLAPNRLQAALDATSSDGLVAHFDADAPVETSAAPIRIALQPERRGRATWSVRGPAQTLFAAARLQDQSLSGDLEGEGELRFGDGFLAGDGYMEVSDGAFEDKLTGVKLHALDTRIAFDDRGVTLERFTATGPGGGGLTATGGSADPQHGRIAVEMRDLRLVDRPDAQATASGDLTLAWEGLESTLSGELNIDRGEVNIAANVEAGIPTIDVIEINRTDVFYEDEPQQPQSNGSTHLDVHIRAPERIFTRGRGVDAEWSLDLRLRGTAANPLFYGTATLVRGTLSLSGQPFDIESGSIDFNGPAENASIDLVAERTTTDLTARIHLSGTATDPDISLSSTPSLPEDEILPQILFGRSVADLSALEAAQVAASLARLTGQGGLDLMAAARSATGLDRLNVRQDEAGGLIVGGGVYLTSDVYVEVARNGMGQAQTQVEWQVGPRLVLITGFLPNGDRRVSLRWRKESD